MCYKKADFLADQVLLTGFAPGGLTEVPQEDFKTCSMGNTLAQELGPFGFKPEVARLPPPRPPPPLLLELSFSSLVAVFCDTRNWWNHNWLEHAQRLKPAISVLKRIAGEVC